MFGVENEPGGRVSLRKVGEYFSVASLEFSCFNSVVSRPVFSPRKFKAKAGTEAGCWSRELAAEKGEGGQKRAESMSK